MNLGKWIAGILVVVLTSLTVQAGDDFYLVKIKGLDKQTELKTMSGKDYKALEAAIKLEQKYLPQAVAEAAKEWRADEFNKGIPFGGNKLTPRSVMMATKYSSSEKAEEALSKIEELQAKKDERESKKKTTKSKDKLSKEAKQENEIQAAVAVVQPKLDALIAKAGTPEAKGVAVGVEAPGGAKVNAAVDKAGK